MNRKIVPLILAAAFGIPFQAAQADSGSLKTPKAA